MAQLLLQQGKVTEALKYFERAAELSRTEGEIVNALSYAEATRTQLEVQEKYPQLAGRLVCIFSQQIFPIMAHSYVDAGYLIASNFCLKRMLTLKFLQQGMGANIGGPMR